MAKVEIFEAEKREWSLAAFVMPGNSLRIPPPEGRTRISLKFTTEIGVFRFFLAQDGEELKEKAILQSGQTAYFNTDGPDAPVRSTFRVTA